MRRFLKKLRKGIKTACVTATLVTCWSVGQPAQVSAAPVEIKFSGTVSPTVNDVSHLYLIYGSYMSGGVMDLGSTMLGDFSAGQTTAFSTTGSYYDWPRSIIWCAAGLYGDVSSGQYIEGVNGVTLGIRASEGNSWEYYHPPDEGTVFNYLLNGTIENVQPDWWGWWHGDDWWDSEELEVTETINLCDFSSASSNGSLQVEAVIVPEPITILVLGTGGIFVLRRRQDKG